jgi:choline monooxygenase
VRDNEGGLRAYFNVCRHHAMPLVNADHGCTPQQQLVCPYHGWAYALDGRLVKSVKLVSNVHTNETLCSKAANCVFRFRMKGIQDFKPSQFSLKPIAIDTIGPFVFLNFSAPDKAQVRISFKNNIQPTKKKLHQPLRLIRIFPSGGNTAC